MGSFTPVIIGILALLYILYRQLQIRQVNKLELKLPVILLLFGGIIFKNFLNDHTLTATSFATVIFSLTILAVGMASIRAYTVRLWVEKNTIYRKGTWLTITLWIITMALHFAVDEIGNIGQSTLLIYYAITLSVQQWVVVSRANRIFSK
ncbi:hypothetical protein A3844_05370 [Paenibacillus helianthi]|uniref:DUF1453 domain-containing protein n=1 Tax=Paenibacillus helianthi TaxID=1349432 RepID=A0ABX3EUS6_9BACL|nr:hypothetical protein [Paenibacillus helianthi]OKP90462.1 hypothetical protein A3844_05370 [Paenibacillus helianthi]